MEADLFFWGFAIGLPFGVWLDRIALPRAARLLIRHGWR